MTIEDFDPTIGSWHEAEDYLGKNAVDFVDRYYDNHGGEPRVGETNIRRAGNPDTLASDGTRGRPQLETAPDVPRE